MKTSVHEPLYKLGKYLNNFKDMELTTELLAKEGNALKNQEQKLNNKNEPEIMNRKLSVKNSEDLDLFFVDEISKDLICPVCSQLLRTPICTNCEHIFCLECIKNKR